MNKNRKQLAKEAILLRATGYDATETVEEYADKDGEMVLLKRRVSIKNVPPDVSAAKMIMEETEASAAELSDEELINAKKRLLKEIEKNKARKKAEV